MTEMTLRDIMICSLQRVYICQICHMRVSLVRGKFPPGSAPRFRFSCEISFTLNYFLGGGVLGSSPNCIVGSAESEGFLILWGLFGPFVPCAFILYLRAS